MTLFVGLVLAVQLSLVFCAVCSSRVLRQLMYFLVSVATAEFSKRFLYAFSDVSSFYYYLLLLPPDLIFMAMLASQKGRIFFNKTYMAACILIIGISLLQNSITDVALNIKTEYVYTLLLIAPAAFWKVREDDVRIFRRTIYALAVLASAYGMCQFTMGYPSWEMSWFEHSPTTMVIDGFTNNKTVFRAYSFFSGLHEFALFLCLAGGFVAFTGHGSRGRKALALLPLAIGLFVSNAKGVYVAVIISCLLFRFRSRLSAIKIMPVVLAPVAFFLFASEFAISNVVGFIANHFGSLARYISPETSIPRLMIFAEYFASLDPHSLPFYLGSGVGSVITSKGLAVLLDNNYLEVLTELGLLGLVGFLALVYEIYREYFWLVNRGRLGRLEHGVVDASFFYVTTVLFDLYGSVDFATRGVLVCFLIFCMLIHTQYRRCFSLLPRETVTPVTRRRYAST